MSVAVVHALCQIPVVVDAVARDLCVTMNMADVM